MTGVRSEIVSPVVAPIISSLVGGEIDGSLALVLNGRNPYYTIYTRVDIGYSLNTIGGFVPNAQNISMFDFSSGTREFLWYAGVDVLPGSGTVNLGELKLQASGVGARTINGKTIQDIFEGVGVDAATGIAIFENFKVESIATDINLLLTNTGTRILWIEAITGLIKATDGVATATSIIGISVDTYYNFEFVWEEDEMYIILNNVIGSQVLFSGSFPVIGEFIKYTNSSSLQRSKKVYFIDAVEDIFIFDDLEQVIDGLDAVID